MYTSAYIVYAYNTVQLATSDEFVTTVKKRRPLYAPTLLQLNIPMVMEKFGQLKNMGSCIITTHIVAT